MSIDLYRVGTPSIGETWLDRFTAQRDSGGLGTGVYAFRTQTAAQENIEQVSQGSDLHILHDALDNPVRPASIEATRAINDLSRRLVYVHYAVERGEATYESLIETPEDIRVSTSSRFGGEEGLGSGKPLDSFAFTILLHTTELREKYGLDEGAFIQDALRATREAADRCGSRSDPTCLQPINVMLWPEFDGIAPYPDAGGNTGRHGCVIFKQKIDRCVGRSTEAFEEISADRLNRCFYG